MRLLVIGLGSMGKRRIRCLQALGFNSVAGVDSRADRRQEAATKCGVPTFDDATTAVREFRPDALIISVPPDVHHVYMKLGLKEGLPFFVEASVTDTDMAEIQRVAIDKRILAAPSATMLFHPAIQEIARLVRSGAVGKVSNVLFHCGQYLPDWHTYENVSDFYVSNPATGGAREIVPFELTWITHVFGFPSRVMANVRKTITIDGAEKIDDTYNCLLDYGDSLISMTIDVVSRFATRRLLVNGDGGQLVWSWDANTVRVYEPAAKEWVNHDYAMLAAATGYNANIGENMYIDELRSFIEAVQGGKSYINTLENDHRILNLLYALEQADKDGRAISV